MTTDMKAAERKNDLRRILSDREGDVADGRLDGMMKAVGAESLHHQVWDMLMNLLAAEPPTPKLSATKLCTLLAKAKALVKVHRPVERVKGWQVAVQNTRTEADENYGKVRALMIQRIMMDGMIPSEVADMLDELASMFPSHQKGLADEAALYREFPESWRDVQNAMLDRRKANGG